MNARGTVEGVARITRTGSVVVLLAAALGVASVSRAQTSAPTRPVNSSSTKEVPQSVVKEIRALLEEKSNRNPAQRKLESHIHFAGQVHGGAIDLTKIPSAKNDEKMLEFDSQKRIHVDVRANVNDDLLAAIAALGGQSDRLTPNMGRYGRGFLF